MTEEKDLFNPAFKDLRLKIEPSQKATRRSDAKQLGTDEAEPDDQEFFLQAMSDVTPLPRDTIKITRSLGDNIRPALPAPGDEQQAMTHLHDLVKGVVELDITCTDEYMEGSVQGFSRTLMKKLRKGEFSVQDYIDLHGLTKPEAETRVREFLLQSYRLGHRCVLIVHGRGRNSPHSLPVLKKSLPIWLHRGPMKKIVWAFATARSYDGGAGAIYVLLRKR